jgi:hypothetical protein
VALFRRRSNAPAGGLAGFWDWWSSEGRELAEQSINGVVEPQAFAQPMAERVGQLGQLGWDLTAGETSEHVLVITGAGDPAARALARRVVLAAPDADATWSYVDSRPPAPDPEAVAHSADGSPPVDFSQVQVTARLEGSRFDLLLHHPSFADLPEESRLQITFLALDAALGEVDTELWLGEVQPVEFPPLDGFGLSALRAVVRDLKSQRLDQDGRPRWAMLSGETQDGPLVAMARVPLHALTAPNLDTYVAVVLPFRHRTDDGLPDEGSLEPLAEFERRLERELGVSGQVVAHMSTAGVRTLHVYVDSAADVLPTVKALSRSWDQGSARVHDMADPGWSAVSHLRV